MGGKLCGTVRKAMRFIGSRTVGTSRLSDCNEIHMTDVIVYCFDDAVVGRCLNASNAALSKPRS